MILFHKVGKSFGDAVALRPTDLKIATNKTTVLIGLRGLLRLVTRQARDKAFPPDTAFSDAFGYARRAMDLVLRARSRCRTRASFCGL